MAIDGQMTIDDAIEARDEAMTRVEDHADNAWKDEAMRVVKRLAMNNAYITTDDVWRVMSQSTNTTHDPRAMGPIMRNAARLGWIERAGWSQQSTRKECHARPIAVWRSLLSITVDLPF